MGIHKKTGPSTFMKFPFTIGGEGPEFNPLKDGKRKTGPKTVMTGKGPGKDSGKISRKKTVPKRVF